MEPGKAVFWWNSGVNDSIGNRVLDKLSMMLLIASVVLALPIAVGMGGEILRGLLRLIRIDVQFPSPDMWFLLHCLFLGAIVGIAAGTLRAIYSRRTTGSFFDDPMMGIIGAVLVIEAQIVLPLLFTAIVMSRMPD
jgi:hypothetical protein